MTDNEFMLAVLEEQPGEWVAQTDLLQRSISERGHGFTPHSRASDLRRLGYNVECQVVRYYNRFRGRETGRAKSFYRLVDQAGPGDAPGGASGAGASDPENHPALFDETNRPAWA